MVGSRPRIRYELDLDAAVVAIRGFNSSPSALAAEKLISQHFPDVARTLDSNTVAERVVLLDSLWGTRLFVQSGASDRIANNLAAASTEFVQTLKSFGKDDLVNQPEKVYAVAEVALKVILVQDLLDPDKYRENYSFATKFLHWCTRQHFPIVDKKARKAINRFQHQHHAALCVRSSTAEMGKLTYVQEYERWVIFYSDLIHGMATDSAERLKREDSDSQPPSYRTENSLLRILDKVFYWQGGGRGLGRVAE